MAVDYNESYAGTSLTHFVTTMDDIYQHEGQLAYNYKGDDHHLGCVIHAPGQTGGLIEQDFQIKLLRSYKELFTAHGKKHIDMYTNLAKIRVHWSIQVFVTQTPKKAFCDFNQQLEIRTISW